MKLMGVISLLLLILLAGEVNSQEVEPFAIDIEETHGTYQGTQESVDITYWRGSLPIAGFDFLIAYDATVLSFTGAVEGNIFADYAWEYFTFRYGPDGNCGPDCPSGLVRLVGIAETSNGAHHPNNLFLQPGDTFATMYFLVSERPILDCIYLPIQFFWMDCGDNSVAFYYEDDPLMQWPQQAISREVRQLNHPALDDIADPTTGYPTFTGAQDEDCFTGTLEDRPVRLIDFYSGGIDIMCLNSMIGDLDYDFTAFELTDAMLYVDYFLFGESVFVWNRLFQIWNADINADGISPTLTDLVYMFRIMDGDAIPYHYLKPTGTGYWIDDGVFHTELNVGAAYFVIAGIDVPILLNNSAEMAYNFDGVNTRVLVYSMRKDGAFGGDLLRVNNEILDFELASYDGTPMRAELIPTEYALHQNYPNPFNAGTTIGFDMPKAGEYELVIYNVQGQQVARFADHAEVGFVNVTWDAADFASGMYFYRLDIDDFTETRKMVLLK